MFGEQKWLKSQNAEKIKYFEKFQEKIDTIFQQKGNKKYLLAENIIVGGINFRQYFYLEIKQHQNYKLVKAKYYIFLNDNNNFITPEMQKKVYTSSYILRNCKDSVLYTDKEFLLPTLIKGIHDFFQLSKKKTENGILPKSRIAAILESINIDYTLTINKKN